MAKIKLEGQPELYDLTVEYQQNAIAISPDDGLLYIANDTIPAGTAWAVGDTGATWKLPTTPLTDNTTSANYQLVSDNGLTYFEEL